MISKVYSFFWNHFLLVWSIFSVFVVIGVVVLQGIDMRSTDDTKESIVAALKGDGFSEISDVRAYGFFPCRWGGKAGSHSMFPYAAKGNFHGKLYDNIRICFYSPSDYYLEGLYVSPDGKYGISS